MTFVNCHQMCEAMATRFEILLLGDDEQHLGAVSDAIIEEIIRLDGVLSRFDPRSEIARINREAIAGPVRVDRELFALLVACEQARQWTEGYFDVTRMACETPALELNVEASTARFARPEVTIDLGGVGKGYALNCARAILTRFGVTRALINGGTSSVLALGPGRGDGDSWPIDLRRLLPPEAAAVARVNLKDRALSCSAVRHPHQAQSDIINPLTGQALDRDAACIVLASSATEAEIFSTALLAMGRERAISFLGNRAHLGLTVGWIEAESLVWIAGENHG